MESRPEAKYRERSWPTSQFLWRFAHFESAQFAARKAARGVRLPNYHQPVPIYEFACESCGHRFEELVGSHVGLDAADVVCSVCG